MAWLAQVIPAALQHAQQVVADFRDGNFGVGFVRAFTGNETANLLSLAIDGGGGEDEPDDPFRDEIGQQLAFQIDAAPVRQTVVGFARVGFKPTAGKVTGPKDRELHLIGPVSEEEIADIRIVYLDDVAITKDDLNAAGMVTSGIFKGQVWINFNTGAPGQTAFPMAVSEIDFWTENHIGEGFATFYIKMLAGNTDWPVEGVPKVTMDGLGKLQRDPRTGLTGWTDNAVVVDQGWLTGKVASPGATLDDIDEVFNAAQANICDELAPLPATQAAATVAADTVEVAFGDLAVKVGDYIEAAAFRGFVVAVTDDGEVSGTLKFQLAARQQEIEAGTVMTLPAGATTVTCKLGISVTIAGKRVTAMGAYFRATYGLFLDDPLGAFNGYVTNIILNGFGSEDTVFELADTLVDARAFTAKDLTDGDHILVAIAEPRYTVNGVISDNSRRRKVRTDLEGAMAGSIYTVGDRWRCRAGAYEAPTVLIDERDATGPVNIQKGVPFATRFDSVRGLYSGPWTNGQPQSYPLVSLNTGPVTGRRYKALDRPYSNSPFLCQRLGRIEIRRQNHPWTITARYFMSLFKIQAGDVVGLSNGRWELNALPCIVRRSSLRIEGSKTGEPYPYIHLALRSTGPEVFTDAVEGQVLPSPASAPPSDRPAPDDVTGFTVSQNGSRLLFRWDAVNPRRLRGYSIFTGLDGSAFEDATPLTTAARGTESLHESVPPSPDDAQGNPIPRRFWIVAESNLSVPSDNPATYALVVKNVAENIRTVNLGPAWTGTRTGLLRHHSGALVLGSTKLASEMTDAELWDQFNPFPVAAGSIEGPVIDLGKDFDDIRVTAEVISRLGPGEIEGTADPRILLRTWNTGETPGAFVPWQSAVVDARFIESRIEADPAVGLPVIEQATVRVDRNLITEQGRRTIAPGDEAIGTTVVFKNTYSDIPTPNIEVSGGLEPEILELSETQLRFRLLDKNTAAPTAGTRGYTITGK